MPTDAEGKSGSETPSDGGRLIRFEIALPRLVTVFDYFGAVQSCMGAVDFIY
ncbi:MAG: hypothetical protein HY070_03980 [Chloroflexi bacterium]|nr:hypothetical protein [Chloroflexota bacterium]